MPIAYDATAGVTDGVGGSSSYSWSHTCTGAGGLLLVMFYSYKAADTTEHVTSVTYAGVAMTLLKREVNAASGFVSQVYGLVNPASGANNAVVNFDTTMEIGYRSASYSGVNGAGLPDSTAGSNGSASSVSLSFTTVADNCWLAMFVKSSPANQEAGANTTRRTGDGFNIGNYDSNAAKTPPGSFALAASWASSGNYAAVGCSFAPLLPPVGKQLVIRQAAKRASRY